MDGGPDAGQGIGRRDASSWSTPPWPRSSEHGPEVTTEQIAAQAGVSRPGLYRHFDGKDDLQAAIAARSVERLVTELEPVWRPSGRPREMLERAIAAHLRWLADARERLPLPQAELAAHGRRLGGDREHQRARRRLRARRARCSSTARWAPSCRPPTAHPLAYGLVGMVDAAAAHWLDEPHGALVEQLGAQLTEACWAVIRVTVGAVVIERARHRWGPRPRRDAAGGLAGASP